tara:strand:+ start:250 stop:525 length:276 start_codon:yes stop_codon:yes gene_type:complete
MSLEQERDARGAPPHQSQHVPQLQPRVFAQRGTLGRSAGASIWSKLPLSLHQQLCAEIESVFRDHGIAPAWTLNYMGRNHTMCTLCSPVQE